MNNHQSSACEDSPIRRAKRWQSEADQLRDSAGATPLTQAQRVALLREATAADRRARHATFAAGRH